MSTWLYIFDEFRPLDIDPRRLFELASRDPMELFEVVRDAVEEHIKNIESIEIHDIYTDVYSHELVVEYIVKCEYGEASVKIIHSGNPLATLQKYYRYEESKQQHR